MKKVLEVQWRRRKQFDLVGISEHPILRRIIHAPTHNESISQQLVKVLAITDWIKFINNLCHGYAEH
jgi:hypothetical protein